MGKRFKNKDDLVAYLIMAGVVTVGGSELLYEENGINTQPTTKIPSEAIKLAQTLAKNVKEKFDFVKIKDKDIERWASDIDKLNRIDGEDW